MKRLYRSREDRMLAGVCGGVAEFFGVDSVLVRIAWAVVAFSGVGVFAYIIAAFIVPEAPSTGDYTLYEEDSKGRPSVDRSNMLLGTVLVGIGILILLKRYVFPFIPDLFSELFWPLVLIFLGALLIMRRKD